MNIIEMVHSALVVFIVPVFLTCIFLRKFHGSNWLKYIGKELNPQNADDFFWGVFAPVLVFMLSFVFSIFVVGVWGAELLKYFGVYVR